VLVLMVLTVVGSVPPLVHLRAPVRAGGEP